MKEPQVTKSSDHRRDAAQVIGTENEAALDISKLRSDTGLITLDEGYVNTGATTSAITFLDGEEGIGRSVFPQPLGQAARLQQGDAQ